MKKTFIIIGLIVALVIGGFVSHVFDNAVDYGHQKIDEAIASLQAAMDALVEKPAETKPEEPEKDDTKKDETKKDETNKDETKKDETKKDNVKTGDMTNILPFAALMGLACVAFIFLKKKKA